MRFSELIQKLANGQTLSPIEQAELVLKARDLEQAEALLSSLIQPGTKNLQIDGLVSNDAQINGDITLRNNGTTTGSIQHDGDVSFGSDLSTPANTAFQIFSNAQTYNGESMGAGDVLIGDNSSGKPNLLWDASVPALYFRRGTQVLWYTTSSDALSGLTGNVTHNSSFNISNGVDTAATFNVQLRDDSDFWSNAEPTKIYVPVTGAYKIELHIDISAHNTGYRQVSLYINGSFDRYVESKGAVPTIDTRFNIVTTRNLTAGDYIEIYLLQNSGSTLTGNVWLRIVLDK